jgi:hypothetical protein
MQAINRNVSSHKVNGSYENDLSSTSDAGGRMPDRLYPWVSFRHGQCDRVRDLPVSNVMRMGQAAKAHGVFFLHSVLSAL